MDKTQAFVIALFLMSVFARVSIDGFYKGYPGNLKAMDPMQHSLETDWIVKTNHYGLMPYYLAQGHDDVVSFLPPFLYLISAAFAMISGIPAYDSIYLLSCIISALAVPLLYLIGKRVFGSEIIGLVAAALYVIPLDVFIWLYGLYIGQWLMAVAFTFFRASVWLSWEFYKKPSWVNALFLGLTWAGSFMTHFPETIMSAPIFFVIVVKMLQEKRFSLRMIPVMISVPLVCFVLFSPNFFFVDLWGPGAKPISFGLQEIETNYRPGSLTDFPPWVWLITAVGAVFMFLNYKKFWFWSFVTVFSLFWVLVFTSIFSPSDYIVRQRFMLPFFIYPIAGFGVYVLIREITKRFDIDKVLLTLGVSIVIVLFSFTALTELQKSVSGEIISKDVYEALNWFSENTPEKSTVFFLNGFYQKSGFFSRRIPYQLYENDVDLSVRTYLTSGEIITTFNDSNWINFFHEGPYKTSFFTIEFHGVRDQKADMLTFDYVAMKDENEYFATYNAAVIEMLKKNNYEEVYSKNGIHIMGRGI